MVTVRAAVHLESFFVVPEDVAAAGVDLVHGVLEEGVGAVAHDLGLVVGEALAVGHGEELGQP